ncbi:Major fimbrium tip subunit FimD [Porphyromonas levii]|uniref:fimbrial tip adhesin FimD n=1 Tax=Porphyromonas levii TaxID=28114 RepID=UPI001BAA2F57|nr:fimbrial protein [Porphyromonas levii]MBR8763283.1 Major fimbrium tip subunit FimD [Porphyromonas levii]
MKKIYTLSSILTLVALMLLGQGCVKENGVDCPELGDNTLALRINVQDIAESRAALRADKTEAGQDPYNENKIEDFTVLFYKEGKFLWAQSKKGLTQDINKNYLIPVPKEQMAGIDGKTEFKIYVVANHTFTGDKPATEDALKAIVVSESIKVSNTEKPAKFVMVGSVTKTINMSTTDGKQLGTVELKRVAAKVRLSLLTVNVDGYTQEGEAQAYLSNARNQGYMDKAENVPGSALFASDYINVNELNTKSAHFYSYYTKWEKDAKERPTLTLMIKLKKNDSTNTEAKAYYYKVPVEAKGQELKSNYLYDVKVKIEILGGLTVEEPQAIKGQLKVIPWKEHSDAFGLPATKYLLVAEKNVIMNNVSTYNIDYQSSSPIDFKEIKAYAKYVDHNGSEQTETYNDVKVEGKEGKITITSPIPENYVPKTIEFDVTNDDGFKEHVKVTQYPSLYITNTFGEKSSLRPNPKYNSDGSFYDEDHLKNKAIYKIVVQVPQDKLLDVDMILGFPPTQNQHFYQDYNLSFSDEITKNDKETSKMVSPSFELASQLGASGHMPFFEYKDLSNITYEGYPQALYYYYKYNKTYYTYNKSNNMRPRPWGAAYNCALYTETRDGKVLDDWRLPTEAEIRLVDKLQHAGKGVVKSIMTGTYYWDSYSYDDATKMDNPAYQTSATKTSAHVRCVRDVKDNTVTK